MGYGLMISACPFNLPLKRRAAWLSMAQPKAARKAVELASPLKNDGVNWDDDIPYMDVGQNGRPMWDHRCECLV